MTGVMLRAAAWWVASLVVLLLLVTVWEAPPALEDALYNAMAWAMAFPLFGIEAYYGAVLWRRIVVEGHGGSKTFADEVELLEQDENSGAEDENETGDPDVVDDLNEAFHGLSLSGAASTVIGSRMTVEEKKEMIAILLRLAAR